jgi:hypothetical protein
LKLHRECFRSLELLSDKLRDGFEALFMKPVEFHRNFDEIYRIRIPENIIQQFQENSELHDGEFGVSQRILNLLRSGLGERIVAMGSIPHSGVTWHLGEVKINRN